MVLSKFGHVLLVNVISSCDALIVIKIIKFYDVRIRDPNTLYFGITKKLSAE